MLAKLTNSEISMFYIVSVAEQAVLSLILWISFHTSRADPGFLERGFRCIKKRFALLILSP